MSIKHPHFEVGEQRFIWLDENGDRTSQYHKTIATAYGYRKALLRLLSGEKVWSPKQRQAFEPEGTGLAPVRLVKVQMALQEVPLTEDEQLDADAAERLDRSKAAV